MHLRTHHGRPRVCVQYFNHLAVPNAGRWIDSLPSLCSICGFYLWTTDSFCRFNIIGATP